MSMSRRRRSGAGNSGQKERNLIFGTSARQ